MIKNKGLFVRYIGVIIFVLIVGIFLLSAQSSYAKDIVTYGAWKQVNKANSTQMRIITVVRDEQNTRWKYIGPGKRGAKLHKGQSLSYSPYENKNPISINVGAGVSISGGIASGSLEVGLSIPMGAPSSGKATVNLSPVKKKGYYGIETCKKVKPTLYYVQYRHGTVKNGKIHWVTEKAKIYSKKYKVIHYYQRYKRFKH